MARLVSRKKEAGTVKRAPTFSLRGVSEPSSEEARWVKWLIGMAVVLLLAGFSPSPARAQVYSASVTGVVTDPSGAVIPDAKVTATNTSNGFTYSTTTNAGGRYTIEDLPPGTYKLSVAAAGFRNLVRNGIVLGVAEHSTVDAKLAVGATTQTVTVTGAAPLLQAQNATTGQTVNRNLINNLPLVGRSVFDLSMLTPGVSQPPVDAFAPNTTANNFVSNGGRNMTADIKIDGTSSTAPEQNTQIQNPLYVPSVDAVQEFSVEQNQFGADIGMSGNTIINVILRSGTNAFHGSAYEYLRNSNLNANNWFSNRAGIPLAAARDNDFGGTFGGPIQKNKTFFFLDYEGMRDYSSATYTAGVPSMAERNGDFGELCGDNGGTFNAAGACSAANGQLWDPYSGIYNSVTGQRNLTMIIPNNNMASYTSTMCSTTSCANAANLAGTVFALPNTAGNLINPVASKMMAYYPLPNLGVGTSSYNRFDNWVGAGTNSNTSNQFDIKVDREISSMTHLDARFSASVLGTYLGANPWDNPLNTDTQGPGTDGAQSAVLNVTHSFSPTLLLQVSYGWTRSASFTDGIDAGFPSFNPETALGLPAYMETDGVSAAPTIYIDGGYTYVGAESLGAQAWSVLHYALETHDLNASLDKIKGRHEFKFGGEMLVYKDSFFQAGTPQSDFEFSQTGTSETPNAGTGGDALASFLTGVGGPGSYGDYEMSDAIETQNFQYAGYALDNWHATSKLTLNLGVRYDLILPATERHNKQEWLDPTAVNPLSSDHLALSSAAAADFTNAGLSVPNLSTLYGGIEFAGSNQRGVVNASPADFAPRFGFAYELTQKTVVRGGYGVFYSEPDYTAHGTGLGENDGFLQDTSWLTTYQGNGYTPWASLSSPYPATNTFSTAKPGGIILPPGSSEGLSTDLGLGVSGYIRNWNQLPYVQDWSFGVQHQFGSMVVSAQYVGSKGTHLYFASAPAYNYFGPWIQKASPAQISALTAYVPNPFYGVITTPSCGICGSTVQASQLALQYPEFNGFSGPNPPWANSEYNALQLKFEKSFSHGLQVSANYTWSHALDDSSVAGGNTTWVGGTAPAIQDPNDRLAEYAPSEYDIPQIFDVGYVYQLPFGHGQHFGGSWNRVEDYVLGGWKTSGYWRFDDGQPLEITSEVSTPLPTYGTQRPDLLAPLKRDSCSETCEVAQFFANPQVAVEPAEHTLGTAARVIPVYAEGTQDADLTLFKDIPISKFGEAGKLEVRLDTFNAFNHVQFSPPNTTVGSGSFGLVTGQYNDPREVQVSAKLYW
jgi:hypothetical protein